MASIAGMLPRASLAWSWVGWFVLAAGAVAQAEPPPPVPGLIDDERLEQVIVAACGVHHAAGALVPASVLAAAAAQGITCEVKVQPPRQAVLDGPTLRETLLPSARIVGHYYLCTECDEWHFSGASGFCLDDAGHVVTCAHVLAPDDGMRQAFLVVADLRGNVWPVVKVAAAALLADVCVLQTTERGAVGLPVRPTVRAGEHVWCLSHPDHQFGFFSDGRVARHYLLREAAPPADAGKARTPGAPRPAVHWLHVTCDFAKGSSGAPIVDDAGNVVGIAQSTTTLIYDETTTPIDTQMVCRSAVPAAALLALLRAPQGR